MIFLALLLTAFVYLIFPIIYVANNGKVSPKKGKKLALSNSIICASIFFFITLIIVSTAKDGAGAEMGGYSVAPAFLYYFIAKAILTDKNLNDNTEKPSEASEKTEVSDMDGENDCSSQFNENSENLNNDNEFSSNVKSFEDLSPELLCLLSAQTHIALNDDSPAEDYVNKVRQQSLKEAQPEIDELFFNTCFTNENTAISDELVDDFIENYGNIVLKHYKKNILNYLYKHNPEIKSVSAEDTNDMLDFMLYMIKEQMMEQKHIFRQKLQSYKKLFDTYINYKDKNL